ncbi:3-isopropylmalate dehydratase small subunit [Variovorax sp. OAS795]
MALPGLGSARTEHCAASAQSGLRTQPATLCRPRILLARENFGCGSSREHAVWALRDHGIRALIAPSFADIFLDNCFKNGLLPIVLPNATVNALFAAVAATPGSMLAIDLYKQSITSGDGCSIPFDMGLRTPQPPAAGAGRHPLTLQRAECIRAFEARRRVAAPWLFN